MRSGSAEDGCKSGNAPSVKIDQNRWWYIFGNQNRPIINFRQLRLHPGQTVKQPLRHVLNVGRPPGQESALERLDTFLTRLSCRLPRPSGALAPADQVFGLRYQLRVFKNDFVRKQDFTLSVPRRNCFGLKLAPRCRDSLT